MHLKIPDIFFLFLEEQRDTVVEAFDSGSKVPSSIPCRAERNCFHGYLLHTASDLLAGAVDDKDFVVTSNQGNA